MYFEKITENSTSKVPVMKAECKKCNLKLAPLVARMRRHYEKCSKNEIVTSNFVIKTSRQEKEILDEKCARFIFASNLHFRVVEHIEFKSFCEKLRPG